MREFSDDDMAYVSWITHHPDGFVLNTRTAPSPSYTILHRATCHTISQRRSDGAYTTRGYRKVAAQTIDELRGFNRSLGRSDGSFSSVCGHCNPVAD